MNTSTAVIAKKRPNRQSMSSARLIALTQAADRAAARGAARMLKAAQETNSKD